MSDASVSIDRLWRDPAFILALVAGPAVWLLLMHATGGTPHPWRLDLPPGYVSYALVFPVLEEIAFRGALQASMYRCNWGQRTSIGISNANVVTSLVFTSLHFLVHAPLWAAAVFLPSLVFGYFRDKYQTLVPALLLHVIYNAGYFFFFGASAAR